MIAYTCVSCRDHADVTELPFQSIMKRRTLKLKGNVRFMKNRNIVVRLTFIYLLICYLSSLSIYLFIYSFIYLFFLYRVSLIIMQDASLPSFTPQGNNLNM